VPEVQEDSILATGLPPGTAMEQKCHYIIMYSLQANRAQGRLGPITLIFVIHKNIVIHNSPFSSECHLASSQ